MGDNTELEGRMGQQIEIIVNGRTKSVEKSELSFDDVVKLAFDNPPTGPDVAFTITYHKGHGNKPEGSLVQGQTVRVKDGMEFNVTSTNRS